MPTFDQMTVGLLGLAFGSRALSRTTPPMARLGFALVGLDLMRQAASGADRPMLGRPDRPQLPASKLSFQTRHARTIDERVGYIREQMLKGTHDPRVYQLARSVLARKCGGQWCVPERDSLGEVQALFAEVRSRVRYTLDPVDFDAFQTPQKTLEMKTGDCDDYTALLGALLRSVGYEVRQRVYHTRGWPTWNHIAIQVKLPTDRWMTVDAIVDRPAGWEVPESSWVRAPRDFPVRS